MQMPQKQNFGVKWLGGATYRHEGRLPSPRGALITICYTPLVVGAGAPIGGVRHRLEFCRDRRSYKFFPTV